MKNLFSFVSIVCLLISQTIAQVPAFDLAKYARPILKRQSLDMATELGTSQFARPFLLTSNPSSNHNLGGRLQLTYRYLHNDLKYQGNSTMILEVNPFHTKQLIRDESLTKQNSMNQHLNLLSAHRWYNQKQYFWGIEGKLNQTYQGSFSLAENLVPVEKQVRSNRFTDLNTKLDLPIVVGKGRLEPIQDARQNVWAQELAFRNPFSANGDEPVAFSSIQSALNVNAYYYLSPRTRLTLTYGGSLIAFKQGLETISPIDFVNELKNQTQFRQSLNLRFEYAWF